MALRVKKTTAMHIDEGEYKAVVSSLQKAEGKYGEYIRWSFLVKNPMSDGEEITEAVKVTGRTSLTLNPKSKLYLWCKACGIDVDEDDIDVEEALKKGVRVFVSDKTGSQSGETISVVTKVMRLKKKQDEDENDEEEETPPKKAKKPAKKEEDAVEDDDDEEEAPAKSTKATKKAPPKDEDDDEEEEPTPKKSKKVAKKEEDDEDDDEDEAPPKKKAKKTKDEDEDDLDDLLDLDDDDD